MRDFLNKSRKKYHLSLGDYKFSPVMEASIALALSYRDLHIRNIQTLPFFLSFPDKALASVWLSTALLVNFFLEDYIDQTDSEETASFVNGEKVEIFNSVAEIESVSNGIVTIKFSDQGGIPINQKLRKHLNKTRSTRKVNKKSLFIRNYKETKINRNPISKILEPLDSVTINETQLKSKVLLVTGRGNAKQLRSILKTSEVYGESLSDIFIENKNLHIKKDLEPYKNIFNTLVSDKENLFKELLLKFLKETNEANATARNLLIELLQSNKFSTSVFKEEFDDFVDDYGDSFSKLKQIHNIYPGVREIIPENIKAVIINEVEQVSLYSKTINGFLSAGIPVFVVSDRHVQKSSDLTFMSEYFRSNAAAFRINWNRKKIRILNEINNKNVEYLDKNLWKNCLRYSNQNINIVISEPELLDKLLYETQKLIKTLVEFETIQQAYYRYLYPAAYLFKNSENSSQEVVELAELFDLELQKNKLILDKYVYILFKEVVDFLKKADTNTKKIQNIEETFANLLSVNLGKRIFIPINAKRINIPDENSGKIFFSGYPYNEFSGKYLNKAVCSDYVPEINISCWPIESQLTYNYLRRRIIAGYFTDNLHLDWNVPSDICLKSEEDFENEVSTFLIYSPPNQPEEKKENIEQELDLLAVTNFRYKSFSYFTNNSHSYRVKCDILNFSDGSFMFLPKSSKVLAQVESDDGSLKFKNSLFSDLEVGFKVFKYQKDRSDFRDLARNNPTIRKSFFELELWKNSLLHLFHLNNSNLDQLEKKLLEIKFKRSLNGNPLKSNIQRWLFDEEIIAPEIDNVKIIFYAIELPEIDKAIKSLQDAYSAVVSYTISLSSKIKKSITNKLAKKQDDLETSFRLNFDSLEIDVESRIITGLEKSDFEIDYHNTRRILI
ncbi:MAG: hypothetical protein ABJA71_07655 [Ginsengibacter sp.]